LVVSTPEALSNPGTSPLEPTSGSSVPSVPPGAGLLGEEARHFSIAHALEHAGFALCQDFLDPGLCLDLLEEARCLWREGDFRQATVGRATKKGLHSEIRNDQIWWLNEATLSKSQRIYWQRMDALKQFLNQRLLLGLVELEAHLARFPAKGFYKPHLDRHRGTAHRVLSAVLYLDPDWSPADGGQLRLYTNQALGTAGPCLDVVPEAGKLALFLSGEIWHEVLPSKRPRHSLTGWFRQRG
jgi:SM-20-related protein